MSDHNTIALLEQRRDDIRDWLNDEAPYTAFDQKHLDASTPERAYWHHGYQSALSDVLHLLNSVDQRSDSADSPTSCPSAGRDGSDCLAGAGRGKARTPARRRPG